MLTSSHVITRAITGWEQLLRICQARVVVVGGREWGGWVSRPGALPNGPSALVRVPVAAVGLLGLGLGLGLALVSSAGGWEGGVSLRILTRINATEKKDNAAAEHQTRDDAHADKPRCGVNGVWGMNGVWGGIVSNGGHRFTHPDETQR